VNALILAAGTGSRLVNLTRDLPKALIPVAGRPLIDHALDFVRCLDCERIHVVGGFYFDKLRDHLAGSNHPNLRLMENKAFLRGSILTLTRALPEIEGGLLLLNVDHIYPRKLARYFAERRGGLEEVTAFVDFDRPLHEDDMKVHLDEGRRHVAKISKGLHEFDAGYIGLTYVPAGEMARYKATAAKVAEEDDGAVVENVLQALIRGGREPAVLVASETRWLEVDTPWDLANAERILQWVPDFLD